MEDSVNREVQLTRRIDFRISEKTYERLLTLAAGTRGVKTISGLLRKIIEEERLVVETYDTSRDRILEELSRIRKEMNAIGVNINQVTRRLNIEKSPEGRLARVLEITRLFQQADLKLTEVFTLISKIAEGWLPK